MSFVLLADCVKLHWLEKSIAYFFQHTLLAHHLTVVHRSQGVFALSCDGTVLELLPMEPHSSWCEWALAEDRYRPGAVGVCERLCIVLTIQRSHLQCFTGTNAHKKK